MAVCARNRWIALSFPGCELGLTRDTAPWYLRLRGRETARHRRAFLDELARAEATMIIDARHEACSAVVATFKTYAAAMRTHGTLA